MPANRQAPPASIADRIRWTVRHLEITQQALATRAGMAPSQLSALLTRLDKRPWGVELETVGRLANAAGVSAMWLLHGFGEPFRPFEAHAAPEYPRLAEYAHWPSIVAALRQAGYLRDDRITQWVGECILPLASPDELTANAVVALARVWVEIGVGTALVTPVALPAPPRPARKPKSPPRRRLTQK